MPSTLNILIVDDEPIIHTTLARFIRSLGHQSYSATTGEAALCACNDRVFNVAIIDIRIPDADGFTLMEQVQQKNADTKIILITGLADLELQKKAQQSNAYCLMEKPLNLTHFMDVINRLAGANVS